MNVREPAMMSFMSASCGVGFDKQKKQSSSEVFF